VDNENPTHLVDEIEKVMAEVKKELNDIKDDLAEREACVEEMGQDCVKKAELQSYLADKLRKR